jgi:hypothetical protein
MKRVKCPNCNKETDCIPIEKETAMCENCLTPFHCEIKYNSNCSHNSDNFTSRMEFHKLINIDTEEAEALFIEICNECDEIIGAEIITYKMKEKEQCQNIK